MQDRFRFRVWDVRRKEWSESWLIQENGSIISFYKNEGVTLPASDLCIQQCTGLKDKNGELIFEGDWIEIEVWFGELSHFSLKECKFKDGKFGYELDEQIMDLLDGEAEIKGNIFEGIKE